MSILTQEKIVHSIARLHELILNIRRLNRIRTGIPVMLVNP